MLNLSMSSTAGAKESGKFLSAGIHNAIFKGITKEVVTGKADGAKYNTMCINFDVENYGELKHNIFEPTSTERAELSWGTSASQVDHFLITCRQVLEAANPAIVEGIDAGTIQMTGSFDAIITQMQGFVAGFVGQPTQIKLLPGKNGFNSIPSYPARIKDGQIFIATRFIGKELTLTANEKTKIEKAQNAAPTNMQRGDVLASMDADFASASGEIDDLPF